MSKTKNQNLGITFVEIIVAVSIMSILAGIVLYSVKNFRDSRLLDSATDEALMIISDARSKTLNSEGDSQYGVNIQSAQLTLFKGSVYNINDPSNKITPVSSLLEIVNISLNGGSSNVLFQRLNGKTDNSGSFVIRLKSDISKSKTIIIKSTGISSVQ